MCNITAEGGGGTDPRATDLLAGVMVVDAVGASSDRRSRCTKRSGGNNKRTARVTSRCMDEQLDGISDES